MCWLFCNVVDDVVCCSFYVLVVIDCVLIIIVIFSGGDVLMFVCLFCEWLEMLLDYLFGVLVMLVLMLCKCICLCYFELVVRWWFYEILFVGLVVDLVCCGWFVVV